MLIEHIRKDQFHKDELRLFKKTILLNPLIKYKPYPKQIIPILYANRPERLNDGVRKPNQVLVGAGGYGGKTFLGSMLAAQHLLTESDYTCLVTRLNYAELLDTNSIWENLVDWCCNEELPQDIRCTFKKSPSPQIIAPNGNIIYFKAFDNEKKKQKFKSTSYDRIVNDEASELPTGVLRFQFRSSRNTSNIPRSIINLSNPGGDSTDYLVEKFVDGDEPYVPLDWRDNPFIDKAAYEGSLNELDYIDQQYQKFGNWHYKPSQGDLINREDIINQLISLTDDDNVRFSLMGVDLAGKGKDKFAIVRYDYLNNGLEIINDFAQTSSATPETMLLEFVDKHNPYHNPLTSAIVIEQEGGGSPLYAQRYFQELLQDYNIPVILKTPKGNKYQRARPLMMNIKKGRIRINKTCHYLEDFIDESVRLAPNNKVSPNLVDSVSLAHNYLHEQILNTGTRVSMGGRIARR